MSPRLSFPRRTTTLSVNVPVSILGNELQKMILDLVKYTTLEWCSNRFLSDVVLACAVFKKNVLRKHWYLSHHMLIHCDTAAWGE